MLSLVLLEHDSRRVKPPSLNAIAFARQLGDYSLLLIGHRLGELAQSVTQFGAKSVLVADDAALSNPVADKYAAIIAEVARQRGATTIVAASSTYTKDVLPRAAALLDAPMLTEVVGIEADGSFRRVMYAGNAFGTVRVDADVRVLTVRATALDAPQPVESISPIEPALASLPPLPDGIEFVSREERQFERPELTEARVIVSGGRPLKDPVTFMKLIGGLADALGGAIGATRAAVDSGIAPNDWQVGQTGKTVAPELYIAVGVSGAIQHLAGMKDSKVIVAINKDADAPIFQVATYGLVGDLFEVAPALETAIRQTR